MEINPKKFRESGKPNKKGFNYLKFSGLAFEMLAFILLGVWGGYKLDEVFSMEYPVFTAVLSLVGVVSSLIYLIKKLPKD
ncbi:AtpZ/AtpI family protein [Reichenbachiella agarivorans]|uniref:AtpZ/AtpI family protein n=1 Tax=Reichenbachiella agarivorans TaxID=2979464 RepID=A0ABY6CZU4_9BACT|nr:AtpZ/AtpI family protein [Reichenbachiella agarivorans]UXP33765.1 AtpZ/AtpI family protein [Reichenbachiella agarivorans]